MLGEEPLTWDSVCRDVADYDLSKENEGWTSGEDTDGGDPVRLPATCEAAGTADAGDDGLD